MKKKEDEEEEEDKDKEEDNMSEDKEGEDKKVTVRKEEGDKKCEKEGESRDSGDQLSNCVTLQGNAIEKLESFEISEGEATLVGMVEEEDRKGPSVFDEQLGRVSPSEASEAGKEEAEAGEAGEEAAGENEVEREESSQLLKEIRLQVIKAN